MMRKKWCAAVLTVVMLMALAPMPVHGAGSTPGLTVEARQVTGTDTVEVSLSVAGIGAYRAAHAVLCYDPEVLEPIQWDTAGTAVSLTATEGADNWSGSVAALTKSPDGVSGKPALLLLNQTTQTTDDPGEETEPAEDTQAGENMETTVAQTGWLYLGAESLTGTLPEDEPVVTVRFRLKSALTEAIKASCLTLAKETDALCAVSPAGYPATVMAADRTSYVLSSNPRFEKLSQPTISWTENVSLYPGGGSGAVSGAVATFFDWDGRVVDAIAIPENTDDLDTALNNVETKLSDKPGYDFDQWLQVYQEGESLATKGGTFTANAEALANDNADIANFTAAAAANAGAIFVQAAYKANAAVNGGKGADTDLTDGGTYYTIGTPVYYQLTPATESTGDYSITCTVNRGSALRAVQPAVKAMVFMKNGDYITQKIDLENTDETQFQLVVPRNVSRVYFIFVDTGGLKAWTSAGDRSTQSRCEQAAIIKEGAGALIAQTAWEYAKELTASWGAANEQALKDAGWSEADRDKLVTASKDRTAALTYQEALAILGKSQN